MHHGHYFITVYKDFKVNIYHKRQQMGNRTDPNLITQTRSSGAKRGEERGRDRRRDKRIETDKE